MNTRVRPQQPPKGTATQDEPKGFHIISQGLLQPWQQQVNNSTCMPMASELPATWLRRCKRGKRWRLRKPGGWARTRSKGIGTKGWKGMRVPLIRQKIAKKEYKKAGQITLLRVIPTMTSIRFVTGKSSGILSGISSGILSGISSGILSGISSGILPGISSGILSDILSGISSGILSGR